jgi:hypothetical protein
MSTQKKNIRPAKKSATKTVKQDSRWVRTAKEIGKAAAAATLPILIQAATEALARNLEKRAETKKPRAKSARRRKPAAK